MASFALVEIGALLLIFFGPAITFWIGSSMLLAASLWNTRIRN